MIHNRLVQLEFFTSRPSPQWTNQKGATESRWSGRNRGCVGAERRAKIHLRREQPFRRNIGAREVRLGKRQRVENAERKQNGLEQSRTVRRQHSYGRKLGKEVLHGQTKPARASRVGASLNGFAVTGRHSVRTLLGNPGGITRTQSAMRGAKPKSKKPRKKCDERDKSPRWSQCLPPVHPGTVLQRIPSVNDLRIIIHSPRLTHGHRGYYSGWK